MKKMILALLLLSSPAFAGGGLGRGINGPGLNDNRFYNFSCAIGADSAAGTFSFSVATDGGGRPLKTSRGDLIFAAAQNPLGLVNSGVAIDQGRVLVSQLHLSALQDVASASATFDQGVSLVLVRVGDAAYSYDLRAPRGTLSGVCRLAIGHPAH